METNSIICKNLKKTFGENTTKVEALKDVNLFIKNNEFVMLMGPSGSGKTTLLSIIAAILNADSGECSVLNNDIRALTENKKTEFRRDNIGFVFQSFNLIPTLTAQENVAIPLLIQEIERNKAFEMAAEMLKKMQLEDKLHRYPNHLSSGEQQRVSIARGCIHNPKILLCDEPTSYLDANTGQKVMEMLQSLQKEKQVTLVVVTHDPRIVEFADRIVEIKDGTIANEINNHH